MSMLSYLHQLFNTDTCHAYFHTLRWKDRPLQCHKRQDKLSIVGNEGILHGGNLSNGQNIRTRMYTQ